MYIIIYIYVIIPICPYFFSALNSAWANFRQRTGHRDPRATNAGPWEVQVLLLAAGRNWGKPHETRGKLIGCRQVGWSEGNCGEQSESWDHDVLGSTECATALRRLFIAMHVDRLTSLMFPSTWIDQIPNRYVINWKVWSEAQRGGNVCRCLTTTVLSWEPWRHLQLTSSFCACYIQCTYD